MTKSIIHSCLKGVALFSLLLGMAISSTAQATPSFSVRYDYYPFQNLDDPDNAVPTDATVRLTAMNLSASYPVTFSNGKTVLLNELSYRLSQLDYESWPAQQEPDIELLHFYRYDLTIKHELSPRWSMLGIVSPTVSSDFEEALSSDDFRIQIVAVLIPKLTDRFSLGLGVVYSTMFAKPLTLPIVAMKWNNAAKLRAQVILPTNAELWYTHSPKLELGLVFGGDWNDYQGDPDIYNVADPHIAYSIMTFGPSVRLALSESIHLRVDGGATSLHRFKLYDNDEKLETYDLKPSGFIKVGLQYGG